MPPRFHAPQAAAAGDVVSLPEEEAYHLARVLRLSAGAPVIVFDGRGHEFDAVVERVERRGAELRLVSARQAAHEPRVAVTLAQAVLKGDKMDDVVRDAVMMGVAAVVPIVTTRSETTLAAVRRGHRCERWTRVALASAKQCGRAVVPPVAPPCELSELVSRFAARAVPSPGLMFVEPAAGANVEAVSDVAGDAPREATILIGPEGGWAPEEIQRAASACRLVALGDRTLRADAAALVALAALYTRWGEF